MIEKVLQFERIKKMASDIIHILVQSELSILPVMCTQMIAYTEFVSRQCYLSYTCVVTFLTMFHVVDHRSFYILFVGVLWPCIQLLCLNLR